MGVFAAGTIADALAPLSCAPSVDAVCAAAEASRRVPWTHSVHVVTSVVASAALLCAVGAGWWWQRARPDSPGARRRRMALGVARIVHADTPAAQAREPRRRGGERPGQVTSPGEGR